MATLIELCKSGDLDTIDPGLEADELPWRCLYGTILFLDWLDQELPNLGHNELYSRLSPHEQVVAMLIDYVSGRYFSNDRRFKQLNWTPNYDIWELKTDEVRIFGWVPQKDAFVCCFGDSKDTIQMKGSYGGYITQTKYTRDKMNLDEPKYVTGRNYTDVISNKD